ncbi:hypothetical protein MF406_18180 (plasmid) [Georgenia sp. TF02-10]|uniref:hypothetical protein n=1 Tax=Georgenia sp. TF02-10 TaxID=2917725 RepID=UPI001FA6CB04|nr:hypothetical protein [Georgenia sp. TF02-10]UNX56577.1 hypothetical protein MF406_18180 [Georgenia sp. TF02-10]
MGRSLPSAVVALLLATTAACSTEGSDVDEPRGGAEESPSVVVVPPSTPSGRVEAELLQYSRDAARGRIQVWLENGTADDLEPTRIVYDDPRLSRPIRAQRLRTDPAGSRRGYPLPLPEPRCDAVPPRDAVVVVHTASGRQTVPVTDPVDVVGQYVAARCFEADVRRLVDLRWADTVPARAGTGTLTLVATPTGRPGAVEVVDVGGTPIFGSPPGESWAIGARVRSPGPARRFELPVAPVRCDSHAFLEAGGATAFRLTLRVGGRTGQFVLRMSPTGGRAAIDYGLRACHLGRDG